MEYLPSIGDIITISDRKYIVKSISNKGILIFPVNDLFYQDSTGNWRIYNTTSQIFSGDPNIDIKILSNFSDKDLQRVCQINTYAASLCNNEDLWINKIRSDFGEKFLAGKGNYNTWREYYNGLIRQFDYHDFHVY
jgi:hypothetical protein